MPTSISEKSSDASQKSSGSHPVPITAGSRKYLVLSIASFVLYLSNILVGWASIRHDFPIPPLDVVPEALLLAAGAAFGVIFILQQEKQTT
ncbi:hypothetical protein CW749_18180 [Vibrio sp. vnigr-6D03]|uniref:PEP-CTERM sorting domain-containing protein n=1 Tax=Vibrio penaeicida TaxID=104609 RepID=A0AAV5NWX7_9VIBR|nr:MULTISPECIES: hypothetical protein [Vibrio]PKF78136.1 hypothetical protein CW749_18180 [Vibrio sp. vnigr-6D03]RTZ24428.1 hypothetical protein EKN09_03540 [Vibrio penaeicida]GLQ74768.1 hypothetical protein GCM10007932_41300 [Vibrio penaeicida]